MVSRGPFALEVLGRTFRFEVRDSGGPYVLGKHGHPLVIQPGARSPFWEAYWQWERQGRRLDESGRCVFKWETAMVQIAEQVQPAAPTTPRAQSKPTAKVTIEATPQGAEIFADGKFVGNSPAVLTLPVGRHQFRVVLNGYKEWSGGLELFSDSDVTLVAGLVRLTKHPEKL